MTQYVLRAVNTDDSIQDVGLSFTSLSYSKTINAVGALTLKFIGAHADAAADIFKEDTRILVFRQPNGGASYLDCEAVWFVTRAILSVGSDRKMVLDVGAKSALDLAARNLIAFASGSSQSTVLGAADNEMKRIINLNIGPGGGTRALRGLSVQGNSGLGANVSKQGGWRDLLQAVQEIARDSEAGGTAIYFDIIATGLTTMQFRTWIGQPGAVRSAPTMSLEAGTLRAASWGFDRENDVNVVYGLGQEVAGARQVVTATDGSATTTPWSRRETTIDARNAKLTAELQSEANAELKRRRPKSVVVTADAADTTAAVYGRDWNYGDRIPVSVGGLRYSCLVESVQVSVSGSKEEVKASLKF